MSRLSDYLDLIEEQAEAAIAAEDAAAAETTSPLRNIVDAFTREFVGYWTQVVGPNDTEPTEEQTGKLRRLIKDVVARLVAAIKRIDVSGVAENALVLGIDQAVEAASQFEKPKKPGARKQFPKDMRATMEKIVPAAEDRAKTLFIVSSGPMTRERMTEVIAVAKAAVGSVDVGTRIVVNRGISAGNIVVAKANEYEVIWRPERDACLDCLALAGVISKGGVFPKGRTYRANGKCYSIPKGSLVGPPLHPNCRCGTAMWKPEWMGARNRNEAPFGGSLPEALRREAQRSVIKGWATKSESDAARRKAAAKLLASEPALPKTVIARAKKKVASRGAFATRIP